MNDGRRRTFESGGGGVEVVSPLLRAVLSYAPCDDRDEVLPTEWIVLSGDGVDASVELRLACASRLGPGVPGPFGSVFYPGNHFEIIVPRRTQQQDALIMINLLDSSAPRQFEFDTVLPPGWTVRVERDGSVTFVSEDGDPRVFIGAAWALDANSVRVRTRYTFEEGTLVQNIDARDSTVYPVLVDPDPDALFTADGQLITDSWEPWLVAAADDIAEGEN